jgi:septum formation topological specificity factor MinE
MLNVEFTLNVLTLIFIVTGAMFTGYYLRSRQLKKKQHKIAELRKEIVYNHAQILELQTEYVTLEKSLNGSKATVLPMNIIAPDSKEAAAL